ncbi:MAG: hypothetical protein WCP19_12470 [Chloroflexota bacterium]
MRRTILYILAGILFFIGLCSAGYGALSIIGSTSSTGNSSWLSFGIGFLVFGVFFILSGVGLFYFGTKNTTENSESSGETVLKIDLPADTKVTQIKCNSCGGAITSNDIKMMAGAPVVTCPYCQATYQLTEEPKW